MNLGIVIIYVQDVQKSTDFYTGVIGLSVIEDQSGPNFVMLMPSQGPMLGLENSTLLPAGQAKPAGSVEIGFSVEDVDATFKQWKDCGVTMLEDPEDKPFGRSFLAKDPDGHYLTVYRLRQN
jgi:predicted enzyme related to lactoylglutathione lyase